MYKVIVNIIRRVTFKNIMLAMDMRSDIFNSDVALPSKPPTSVRYLPISSKIILKLRNNVKTIFKFSHIDDSVKKIIKKSI